jgi:hypothetical protein
VIMVMIEKHTWVFLSHYLFQMNTYLLIRMMVIVVTIAVTITVLVPLLPVARTTLLSSTFIT